MEINEFKEATKTVSGYTTRNVRWGAFVKVYLGQVFIPGKGWSPAAWNHRGEFIDRTFSYFDLVKPSDADKKEYNLFIGGGIINDIIKTGPISFEQAILLAKTFSRANPRHKVTIFKSKVTGNMGISIHRLGPEVQVVYTIKPSKPL